MSVIYVDLDGVLCDFDAQLDKLLGRHKDNDVNKDLGPEIWKKIEKAGAKYWSTMPWMPDGKELWDGVKKHHPVILSSPTRHESSIEGKKLWIDKEIPGTPYILEENKEKYAKVGDILIDDRDKNIEKWEEAGGTGILHKNAEKTLKKLDSILKENRKKTAREIISEQFRTHPVIIDPYDAIVQEAVKELGPSLKDVDVIKLEMTCPGNKVGWVSTEDFFKGEPGKQRVIHLCLKKIKDKFKKIEGQPYTITDPSEKNKMKDIIKTYLKDVVLPHETEHVRQEMKYDNFGPGAEQKAEKAEEWKALEDMGITKKSSFVKEVIALYKESEDVLNPFTGETIKDRSMMPHKNFLHKIYRPRLTLAKNVLKGLKDPKATAIFSKIEQIEKMPIKDQSQEDKLKEDLRDMAFKYGDDMGEFIGLLVKDFNTTREEREIYADMKRLANIINPIVEKIEPKVTPEEKWKQHLQKLKSLGLRTASFDIVAHLDLLADSLEEAGYMDEAYEIDIIANTLEKYAIESSTWRGLQILWDKFKGNLSEFSARVRDLIKRNRLSYQGDKGWLQAQLEKLTGRPWKFDRTDFSIA